MAETKKSQSPWVDVWWLLGVLTLLFLLWVMMGGPERATKEGIGPIINGPVEDSSNQETNNSTPHSGEMQVETIN
jgi:hypothetical protein